MGVPGAHLARVDQALAIVAVVANQQRPQADAGPLRVGEAADDKLLPSDALDLHPRRAAALDVRAVQVLADDAFTPRAASLLPQRAAFFGLIGCPAHAVRPAHDLAQQ